MSQHAPLDDVIPLRLHMGIALLAGSVSAWGVGTGEDTRESQHGKLKTLAF